MRFEIEGAALELDILDDEVCRRVTAAFVEALEAAGHGRSPAARGEAGRVLCTLVCACFEMIFGEGTARRVFGGQCTPQRAMRAFERLAAAVCAQQDAMAEAAQRAARRYGPQRARGGGVSGGGVSA